MNSRKTVNRLQITGKCQERSSHIPEQEADDLWNKHTYQFIFLYKIYNLKK